METRTRTEEAGFFSFIGGVGMPTTETRTITVVQGSATGYSEQTTATTSVTIQSDEGLLMRPYFDTLYRTFAFVELSSAGPMISGSVTGRNGRPVLEREVLLTAGLRRIRTRTDSTGRFQIPAGGLAAGRITVTVDGQRDTFEFANAPTSIHVRLR
jgi:hypothetical protein